MALRDRILRDPDHAGNGNERDSLVSTYRNRLLEEINLDEVSSLSMPQRRARLERMLSRILSAEGPVMSSSERVRLIERVVDESVGLGILEPLIADQTVTEIMVNGTGSIFVERAGRLERLPQGFSSEEEIYRTIDRIVSSVNRRVDESSPMVDARLAGGERVNVIIPPLALDGPTITIRRFPQPFRLNDLVTRKSLPNDAANLLMSMVRARLNILVSGGTGTGKTTFLNALSGAIPEAERILTIEDAAELSLQQSHVVRMEARPANSEGKGQVTIRDLVRNALRMRPDRIVVGEVRGGETLDMLQAMNTGHEGSLTTVHANSTVDALSRLETLASMSDISLPVDTIRDQINGAIDIIVQLERDATGARRVSEIAEITSERRESYMTQPIMRSLVGTPRDEKDNVARFPLSEKMARRLTQKREQIEPAYLRNTGGAQ
ncbi:CpaF family protein [Actinomyces naeslundii]|jgi:putative type II secretion system protein E|uniref:CpaF family protein n=1 Tax=Actinomyces naeslundii TaxID=1655 RepID=UPI00096FFA03|nr:CpaF family protein [Actinomyces naeslundii]OMG07216.1 secretion protein [Actinomyces naeslundii]OMG14988.1 secretion protein [Actinomyces naeslundii]OMG31738.1 secretion protein [Actinomyces naeslundii]PKY94646.1 CpaF family protein [Actinomyces naeslundii]